VNDDIEVSNQLWLKVFLLLGTALAFGFAIISGWTACCDLAEPVGTRWIMFAMAILFTWFVKIASGLLKVINHVLVISAAGITIRHGSTSQFYLWPTLRFHVREFSQVIEVRNFDGQLLYAVDWWASNANYLLSRARDHGSRTGQ